MAETNQRSRVVKALRKLDAMAVENPARPGTPDVEYIGGWIELKWLRAWPVREATPVVFSHYTERQRIWHLDRRRAGGTCWFLVQCQREWLLLDGAVAALNVNYCTRTELRDLADVMWLNGLNEGELRQCVQRTQKEFSLTEEDEGKLRSMLLDGGCSL